MAYVCGDAPKKGAGTYAAFNPQTCGFVRYLSQLAKVPTSHVLAILFNGIG
jgi:hypothetical protein